MRKSYSEAFRENLVLKIFRTVRYIFYNFYLYTYVCFSNRLGIRTSTNHTYSDIRILITVFILIMTQTADFIDILVAMGNKNSSHQVAKHFHCLA